MTKTADPVTVPAGEVSAPKDERTEEEKDVDDATKRAIEKGLTPAEVMEAEETEGTVSPDPDEPDLDVNTGR